MNGLQVVERLKKLKDQSSALKMASKLMSDQDYSSNDYYYIGLIDEMAKWKDEEVQVIEEKLMNVDITY